jgi:hypothetical protein
MKSKLTLSSEAMAAIISLGREGLTPLQVEIPISPLSVDPTQYLCYIYSVGQR